MSGTSPTRRVFTALGVGVVIVLALVAILTALRTELPRDPGVMSDAVGPESGEPVADYVDRAAGTLTEAAGGAPRWALVSADRALTAPEAAETVADLPRVSALYVQVPLPGVAMPVSMVTLAEPVAGETSREPAFQRALSRLASTVPGGHSEGPAGGDAAVVDRESAKATVSARRIRAGEPTIIGLVVRGSTTTLSATAQAPGVRAVEALPADAVWGRFAARPLLPQQRVAADPLPDHSPLPIP